MARQQREISKEFLEYQETIANHKNYATLPNKKNKNGELTWVRQGDAERAEWWDSQKSELMLKDRASVARHIHPIELNGLKPCQVCGKKMSIYRIYPNTNYLKKINQTFEPLEFRHFDGSIESIAIQIQDKYGPVGLFKLAAIFDLDATDESLSNIVSKIIKKSKGLSPGVMSNAPDRLDGFHTYNACCRSTHDTGRHATNLARYSTDRRAYESWAEGDWRGADRLMGIYKKETRKVPCPKCGQKRKMSADHIGPISLGFMHRLDFQPMCSECNSSKNNRLTYFDVSKLVETENEGIPVVSWHSEAMWKAMKLLITDYITAIRASVLLRRNMHHVLVMLSIIHESGFDEFLMGYLHPEYALFDFEFEDFDPATGGFRVRKYPVQNKNTASQAERYVRISFETLEIYAEVENRNAKKWTNKNCDVVLDQVLKDLSDGHYDQARAGMLEVLNQLARQATAEF